MNLTIKQSTTLTENSSSSNIVEALYQLTKPDPSTGLPSANAILKGRIQVPAAYEDAVNFLNTQFSADNSDNGSDFQVTVLNNNYYIRFADPEVVSALTDEGVIQEGEGLTVAKAATSTFNRNSFSNNQVIEHFDEFKYFTKMNQNTDIGDLFNGCVNLISTDLTNITKLYGHICKNCNSLRYFNGEDGPEYTLSLPNLTQSYNSGAQNSFNNCTLLKHVTSLGIVPRLEGSTFVGCTNLEDVTLPSQCVNLQPSCFQNCSKLSVINISQLTTIGYSAFEGCSLLEYCDGPGSTQGELNLPYLNTIGNRAFHGCSKLTSVSNLGHITEIPYRVFENCTDLTTINFPNSVRVIGDNAFEGTAWYNAQPNGAVIINNVLYKVKNSVGSTYTIPDGITFITKEAFKGISDLTEVTFPNSMIVTEGLSMENAFDDCTALTTVNNLHTTLIPRFFCYNCKNLTTITIPSTVTAINDNAFSNCNLLSINIPASVTSIYNAFSGNVNCTSITVDANNTVYDSRNNCNAIIHTASNQLIKACKNTVIPNTVTQLNSNSFSGIQLTSIDVPSSVRIIQSSTFSSCHMNSITLNEGLEEVGSYGLSSNNFTTITFPSTLQLLSGSYGCVDRCTNLQQVIFLGTTAPVINQYALFYAVPNTCKIYVPDGCEDAYKDALRVKNEGLVDRVTPMSELPTT